MYPYRCRGCQKLHYSDSFTKMPSECCKEGFDKLVKICLLVPCEASESPILTSQDRPGICEGGRAWKVACGSKFLPPIHTNEPSAATCKKCKEYANEYLSAFGWEEQSPSPETSESSEEISFRGFEDDDIPNPFESSS